MASLLDIQFNIDQIIQKYGPTVWSAAERQVQVTIMLDLVWAAIFVLGALVLAIGARRVYRYGLKQEADNGYSGWDEGKWVASGVCYAVALMFTILALVNLNEAANYWLNPAWAAIHLIKP